MVKQLGSFLRALLCTAAGVLVPFTASAQAPDPILSQAQALFDQASADLVFWQLSLGMPQASRRLSGSSRTRLGRRRRSESASRSREGSRARGPSTRPPPLFLRSRARRIVQQRTRTQRAWKARVAFLTIVVPAKARAAAGLTLSQDGERLEQSRWDTPWPVDKGAHEIAANASGYEPFKATVKVDADGDRVELTIDLILEKPAPIIPAPPPPLPRRWQSAVGVAAVAAGAAGLGIGFALGYNAMVLNDKSNADGHCDVNQCDIYGYQKRSLARDFGDVATAAVIAGSVLEALGVAVIWTAPRSPAKQRAKEPPVALTFGGTGLWLTGAW